MSEEAPVEADAAELPSKTTEFQQQFQTYIRAGYPILYVVTRVTPASVTAFTSPLRAPPVVLSATVLPMEPSILFRIAAWRSSRA